jgi:hypothetical protein
MIPLVALWLGGCSTRDRDVVIRSIPGTEQVAVHDFSISVSPDERCLVFTEWVLPKAIVFEQLPPDEYESRVVTLNLDSGDTTRHTIDSLPADALGFSPYHAGWKRWKRLAGLEIIEKRFRPPGWTGAKFYFQPYNHGIHLALDPRKPGVKIVPKPDVPGACCDCPHVTTTSFHGRSWDLLSNDVSAITRDGAMRAVYYRGEGPGRTHMILRLRENGEEEVVVERELKKDTFLTIARARVSPDERCLAYAVYSSGLGFFSGGYEELFIMDLNNGDQKRVARHQFIGNLIWSANGDRLYFAGGEYDSNSAVFIVNVAATFSR